MSAILSVVTRRRWALVATLAGAAAFTGILLARSTSLHDPAYLSGWVLMGSLVFLSVYNLRKKLPYPPLLRSSTWLQAHLYVGALSALLFLFHTGFRVPNGPLEVSLALLYVSVAGTGVLGLFLSRVLPPRLAVRGQEVLFERIPVYRRQFREQVEQLVLKSVEGRAETILADFYRRKLADFFLRHRNTVHHLLQSTQPLHRMKNELRTLERYLSDEERGTARELAELIEAKDALDYHQAMQALLKGWLFLHIPLTYGLMIVAGVHVVLAYAFSGTVR